MTGKRTVTAQLVTDDPNTGEFVIYLVEDGPWPESADEWELLLRRVQVTILDAADAAIDGGVVARYPDTMGKQIRIQLDSPSGCPEPIAQLVTRIGEHLITSEEYASAINSSKFILGLRIVTGHMLGRFDARTKPPEGAA